MRERIFLVLAIGVFLLSCTSDNSVDCPEDYSGALIAGEEKMVGEWVLVAITAEDEVDLSDDSEDNPSTDIFAQYSECQRDGAYVFTTNRGYTFKQGLKANNCERTVDLSGTWQLVGSTLSLVGSCNIQNLAIEFNDENSAFIFKENFNITDTNGSSIQTEVSFTYSLQQ